MAEFNLFSVSSMSSSGAVSYTHLVGTLTIAMNNLVKKGYVIRTRSEKDRRVVLISLDEKGRRAYKRHEQFHLEMVRAMRQGLDEEQCQVLTQAMRNLRDHFKTV